MYFHLHFSSEVIQLQLHNPRCLSGFARALSGSVPRFKSCTYNTFLITARQPQNTPTARLAGRCACKPRCATPTSTARRPTCWPTCRPDHLYLEMYGPAEHALVKGVFVAPTPSVVGVFVSLFRGSKPRPECAPETHCRRRVAMLEDITDVQRQLRGLSAASRSIYSSL